MAGAAPKVMFTSVMISSIVTVPMLSQSPTH